MSSADVAAPSTLGAWLALARVSNTPTVVSNTIAGAVLASTVADVATVVLVAVAMALFYTAGMILNDVLDEEIDRVQRPERPIPSGVVTRSSAIAAVAALFAVGEALLLVAGIEAFLAGAALIALIVLYDSWHKGNALSPVLMGGCRALVYVVAALAVAGEVPLEVWTAAGVLLLYIVGLTQVAKSEGTSLSAVWPLAAVLAADRLLGRLGRHRWFALLLVAFAAWVVRALWLVREKRRIGQGVVSLIAGVALFDALAVASAGGSLAAVAACVASSLSPSGCRPRSRGPDFHGQENRRPVHRGAHARPRRAGHAAPEVVRRRRRDGAARRRHARRHGNRAEHLPHRAAAERARRGRQRLAVPGHDGGAPVAAVEPARAGAEDLGGGRRASPARTSPGGSPCTRRPT